MNLKELFRYQSYLSNLLAEALDNISKLDHALAVTKIHHRNKTNSEAEDYTETDEEQDFISNDRLLGFIRFLLSEKELVSVCIKVTKANLGTDIDGLTELNKKRRDAASRLRLMLKLKGSTTTVKGSDYKFNAEGEQISYFYDVDVIKTESFDRNKANAYMKELLNKADEDSAKIEQAMITTDVGFDPLFSVNDSLEEAVEKYENALKTD